MRRRSNPESEPNIRRIDTKTRAKKQTHGFQVHLLRGKTAITKMFSDSLCGGKEAARRTLRRLGARKVKTADVPVVLDPMVASSMLEHIFEGVNGDSVYRGASFLAGKLGEKIREPKLV